MRRPAALTAWALAVLLVPAVRADQAPWLGPDWTVRRIVEAKTELPRYGGGETVVCAFYSGGLTKADASDVRVAVGGRKLVNHRVIQVGPGHLVRIAFEAVPNETRYYVYYGNPKADRPAAWQPQRGVLLEARKWTGGPVDRLDQVQAAWAKAAPVGGDFVSHISFGFNPFGESEAPAIYHYTGWFVPPQSGTYMMDISSNGASWLLVDGEEIIAWGGSHGPSGHARRAKPVALTQALHRIDFWNVNEAGSALMLVAWQPPGAGGYEPVPPKAFLPVVKAALLETEVHGARLVADFFADNAGETWWPDRYAVRMQFKNLTRNVNPQTGVRFEWDFGDGQTSTLPNPSHIYLVPGDYTVSLKCSRAADSNTFRTVVHVNRNWWRQADPNIDPAGKYAEEVAQYDFARLDTRNLMAAIDLFEHESSSRPLVAAVRELLRRSGIDEAEIHRLGLLAGQHLRIIGQAAEAVSLYLAQEQQLRAPPRKAEAAACAAETLLRDLRRWDEAEKEFQRILQSYATAGADMQIRRAHIGLGDVWRHRSDGAKARQAYGAAAAIRVAVLPPNEAAVRVGTLARHVEEYTRQEQWEWVTKFLDDWAWEFPLDKLHGHWSYLKAQALFAQHKRDEALLEAMDLVGANPQSAYAVRLLMLAAECHVAAGETDKARLLLQSAVEDYPEDPQQDAAKKRLAALGGPVRTEPPKR